MSAVRVVLWESLPNNRGVAVQDVTCATCASLARAGDVEHWCWRFDMEVSTNFACAAWEPRSGIGDDEGTP